MNKYIAKTTISISVSLPNGGNTRICFTPCMNGSSVYYTDDKDIQWALEHHHKFGKMFRLVESEVERSAAPKKKVAKSANKKVPKGKAANPPQSSDNENEDPAEEELEESIESLNEVEDDATSEISEVTVSDMDAAKDYLAEHFEVVRTKLKNEEIIKETALAFGIVFKFL